MTNGGGYRAMNRSGMESCCSPYQQMSFETTTQFLANACLLGETEEITSASARLVMGRVVGSGTGSFELLHPVRLKKK
jgi:DNA-directed RNA polymerase I subunit RPA1